MMASETQRWVEQTYPQVFETDFSFVCAGTVELTTTRHHGGRRQALATLIVRTKRAGRDPDGERRRARQPASKGREPVPWKGQAKQVRKNGRFNYCRTIETWTQTTLTID